MGQCIICDTELKGRQTKFCSYDCKKKHYGKYKNKSKKSIESSKRATKKWYDKLRLKRGYLFGTKCFICGSDVHLVLHRKDGVIHHVRGSKTMREALKNPEMFSRICMKCHIAIHWIMKHYRWTWEEIIRLI